MRKVVFQVMTSIDGYFEGPNSEIDWHNVDNDFNSYDIDFLNTLDTLVFGRKTYELMASYWPTETAIKNEPHVAEKMNNLSKIVYSTTLGKVDWNIVMLLAS